MRKTISFRKTAIILAVAMIVTVAVFFARSSHKAADVQYFAAGITSGPLRNVVNATGVVQTVVTVQVGSQISGQVQELYADFNSVVKRGQLLARLDQRNIRAQLENARATVAAAAARVRSSEAEMKTQAANRLSANANLEAARVMRDNTRTLFERAAGLNQSGVVSRNEYDNTKANADSAGAKYEQAMAAVQQAEAQELASAAQLEQVKANLQQSQADLNRAEINLEYTNIYSPVDGVVISRNVDVGQTIAATMSSPTLFSIANDLKRMQVNASVDEADIGNISDSADVKFTVDAYPNEVFTGKIAEIRLSPQTIQNVVTYSVILSIENPEMKLKPGMTANITITVDRRANVLRVPNAALRYAPAGMKDEDSSRATGSLPHSTPEDAARPTAVESAQVPLAPGQKWNPENKIRFSRPHRQIEREAAIWVQDAAGQPEPRRIVVGITDGSMTEVVSGELKEGDSVIIGDSTQAGAQSTSRQRSFGPFGPR